MKTVHEVSELTGVSVRALHHYDAVGLLKPTAVTEAGYRLYDDAAIARLQSILLFRELEFPLKSIKAILDSPEFDARAAMLEQIKLLELRREQIDKLILLARETIETGEINMDFSAFDKSEFERYAAEAKQKWGGTAQYAEYDKKPQGEKLAAADALMAKFAEIGALRALSPDSVEAQSAVRELQSFITEHFYTCTDEVLAGLGLMYTADERFKSNIDSAGGSGTAEFIVKAIEIYCNK